MNLITYTLSKILPLLVLPLGISFFILFLSLNSNSRSYIKAVIVILWTFSLGFVSQILWELLEHPWYRIDESQASKADAIVVLSSGVRYPAPGNANIIEWNDPDRFLSGIKLFQEKKAPKLFFTGGSSRYSQVIQTEGALYRDEAIRLGIPSKSISITEKVFNTADEAREIRKNLINKSDPTEILLVTSAFHMQRAKRQFERQGFIVYPFPVDFKATNKLNGSSWKDPYNWVPNAKSLSLSSKALRELIGRIIYRSW